MEFGSLRTQNFTYDSMGNPTNYNDVSLTWQGKQLKSYTTTNGYMITALHFAYDENGLRTQKTVSGFTTNYYYNGTVLIGMQKGNVTQRFSYDASGKVVSVNYNGTDYYYLRNAQGDIVKLIDNNSNTVVEYTYDSWGKILSTTGSKAATLGTDQPFRYRGYVYDNETGWYYLQTRYYDPNVGRFISADIYLSTGQGVIGHNSYAYCLNNPICSIDSSGTFSLRNIFTGAGLLMVGIAAVGIALSVVTCGAAAPLVVAVAGATFVAGGMTIANGASEVIEGLTATNETSNDGYNPMRDTVMHGDSEAYYAQSSIFAATAQIGTAGLSIYTAAAGSVCFIAGTAVLTETGIKTIETIVEGDYVYATNPETGESGYKRVVQTFEKETYELIKVKVDGETITTTPTHPFYVPQKGWTEAVHLRAGDILVTCNGEYAVVELVQHELLETPITVYNFEVEDFHTYYVAANEDAEFVLVHNRCVVKERGVKVEVRSREHGVPHAHISGNGPNTTVGLNKMPMKGHPQMSIRQWEIVNKYWDIIEDAIKKFFN